MSEQQLRSRQREAFVENCLRSAASIIALPQDASFRRYFRVTVNRQTYILMDAPPDKENTRAFVQVDQHLEGLGLYPPHIIACDLEHGFLLLEDFGGDTFTCLLQLGADETTLYKSAIDTLVDLHQSEKAPAIDVSDYSINALLDEALLLPDWFYPLAIGEPITNSARQAYVSAWQAIIHQSPEPQNTLVLRDFHVDNLMRIEREGEPACGLLDFQDALIGPIAYDVMSLLQDARRDLSPGLEHDMLERYFQAMGSLDRENFQHWYLLLAAQRHCKVLGIFCRLFSRDGKPVYLSHLPRVCRLLEHTLEFAPMAPLGEWLSAYMPDRMQAAERLSTQYRE